METNSTADLLQKIEQLKSENREMRLLATDEGFMQLYFERLHQYPDGKKCFLAMQELYLKYFNEEKFAAYKYFLYKKGKYLKNEL